MGKQTRHNDILSMIWRMFGSSHELQIFLRESVSRDLLAGYEIQLYCT